MESKSKTRSRTQWQRVSEVLKFFATFLSDPKATGAIVPSSRNLAEAMLKDIQFDELKLLVEIGPGTGAFTRVIRERLKKPQVFLGVDLNADFVKTLRKRFKNFQFEAGSATELPKILRAQKLGRADYVISSIPWALFSEAQQRELLANLAKSLSAKGEFRTFAYVHATLMPAAKKFRALLGEHFAEIQTSPVVWQNFPPAVVYRCRR